MTAADSLDVFFAVMRWDIKRPASFRMDRDTYHAIPMRCFIGLASARVVEHGDAVTLSIADPGDVDAFAVAYGSPDPRDDYPCMPAASTRVVS